jgi:hypothetical protein
MRVKIHKQIETFGKTGLDRRHIREKFGMSFILS